MDTINDLFEQAELSEASYADFVDDSGNLFTNPDDIKRALRAYSFSDQQATDFLTHWKVIAQCPNTPYSGFSGTVFERLDENGEATGERIVAIRGTEGSKLVAGFWDITEDLSDIGADGIAISQAIDMYNWYQKLLSPAETPYTQYKYNKEETDADGNIIVPPSIEKYYEVSSKTGALYFGSEPTTVVGHSLGGHLALILSRLIPNITSATTFNAPGFDSQILVDLTEIGGGTIYPKLNPLTSERFFDLLRGVAGSEIGTGWNASMDNFRIPGDVVSQIGTIPTDQPELFSEAANTDPFHAHLMPAITDALAVCDLYAQVDSSLTLDTMIEILKASTYDMPDSLESAVRAIGDILAPNLLPPIERDMYEYRDRLYQDCDKIISVLPETSDYSIKAFITLDINNDYRPFAPSEIKSLAQSDIAYRYALVKGNVFALMGGDYSQFDENGELDIYTNDTPNGQLSDQYLTDRSEMLSNWITANTNDTTDTGSDIEFVDLTKNVTLNEPSIGNPSEKMVFGTDGSDVIEGSKSLLSGDDVVDHLYGSSPKAFSPHRAVFLLAA